MKRNMIFSFGVSLSFLALLLVSFSPNVFAQTAQTVMSDYQLDIKQGEQETANDAEAQAQQQEITSSEESEGGQDSGNPNEEPARLPLNSIVEPQEAQESASLVENTALSSSETSLSDSSEDQTTTGQSQSNTLDQVNSDDNQAPADTTSQDSVNENTQDQTIQDQQGQ